MDVSLIIPALNPKHLDEQFASLEPQRSHLAEVMLVDDGSDPALTAPSWVRLVRIDRPPTYGGCSAPRNYGASLARGDWLFFLDSDMRSGPRDVESMVAEAEMHGPRAVVNVHYADVIPLAYESLSFDVGCMLVEKAAFETVGGFDAVAFPRWGCEGLDFLYRWFLGGGTVISCPPDIANDPWAVFPKRLDGDVWAPRDTTVANEDFRAKWGREAVDVREECVRLWEERQWSTS